MNKKGQVLAFILIAFLVTMAYVGVGYLIKAVSINVGLRQQMNQIDSAGKIIDKTYDADNAIYNYEWFKTQHEKIIASEKQIDNSVMQLNEYKEMYGEPKNWDYQVRQQYEIKSAVVLGQKNHYEDLVADYNARSKMANRQIFNDKLPFDVNKKIW